MYKRHFYQKGWLFCIQHKSWSTVDVYLKPFYYWLSTCLVSLPQEYNRPRFRQCDECCAFGIAILLYIDKGVPVAHRPTQGTFTLCPSPCPSPCPYQSPCPNNSHFLMKLEAVFRLHQFPYQSPIQCHQISVRSVSIGPPTVKNWYGRPFPFESCKSLYKITLWRLARQLWTWN